MIRIWEKWKLKWKVESDGRMAWIFLIFAITGSTTALARKSVYKALGIQIDQPIIDVVLRIVVIYFFYQILLFVIGTLLGEYKFVKWFLLKMNKRFLPKRKSNE